MIFFCPPRIIIFNTIVFIFSNFAFSNTKNLENVIIIVQNSLKIIEVLPIIIMYMSPQAKNEMDPSFSTALLYIYI